MSVRRRSLAAGAALLLLVAPGACRARAPVAEAPMPTVPIAQVLARHRAELLALPGVNGVGEGAEAGRPVVLVLVVRDRPGLRAKLPRTLEGYPVRVREVGGVRAN